MVGHELVHIAQRHFDEDAHHLLVLSGKPANWTRTGETALHATESERIDSLMPFVDSARKLTSRVP